MNVLYLSNRVPYPTNDGATKATMQFLQTIVEKGCKVDFLTINTSKHYWPLQELPDFFQREINIEDEYVNTDVTIIGALKGIITNRSYHVSRFNNASFRKKIKKHLQSKTYDIIHLENLFVGCYIDTIRKYSNAKIVMRNHNIEYKIWEKLAEETHGIKKWYLSILAKQLKDYEYKILPKVDGHISISNQDKITIDSISQKPSLWIPYGVTNVFDSISTKHFGFIGSMDWKPNEEAMDWFLKEIWPNVTDKNDTQFYLAGKKMPTKYKSDASQNLSILGKIDDLKDFYNKIGTIIIPLKSGSGMRIKMIEAMAYSKAIVTTSVGAEGILQKSNSGTLIANTTSEMIDAIQTIIDSKNRKARGIENQNFVKNNFDSNQFGQKIVDFYKSL